MLTVILCREEGAESGPNPLTNVSRLAARVKLMYHEGWSVVISIALACGHAFPQPTQ
jgi:hypothetical protein